MVHPMNRMYPPLAGSAISDSHAAAMVELSIAANAKASSMSGQRAT
jgi:hypothetical protein